MVKKLIYTERLITSIIFLALFPLLPIFLDYVYNSHVAERTLALSAAMYAFATAVSSKRLLVFSLSMFIGMLLSLIFGSTEFLQPIKVLNISLSVWIIIFIFCIQFVERYIRHIREGEPAFLFKT